jgi:hypothetical protein
MKISLQTFLQESLSMAAGRSAEPVNESFRWQDTAKAMALIKKYLAKKGIYGPNYMQSAASSTLGDVYVYMFLVLKFVANLYKNDNQDLAICCVSKNDDTHSYVQCLTHQTAHMGEQKYFVQYVQF